MADPSVNLEMLLLVLVRSMGGSVVINSHEFIQANLDKLVITKLIDPFQIKLELVKND